MGYILFALREISPAVLMLAPLYFLLHKLRFHEIRKSAICYFFSLYLCSVYALVGLPNITYIRFELYGNLVPLRGMMDGLKSNIFNVLMFVPLGIFLPLLWERYGVLKNTVFFGFGMSMMIELLQIFTLRATDINDVITNTTGTLLGWFLAKILMKKIPIFQRLAQNEKDIPLIFASAIFVMFFLQPFAVALL